MGSQVAWIPGRHRSHRGYRVLRTVGRKQDEERPVKNLRAIVSWMSALLALTLVGVTPVLGAGTLDLTFNPAPTSWVRSTAVQPDGKILVGGYFSAIGGGSRNRIARL